MSRARVMQNIDGTITDLARLEAIAVEAARSAARLVASRYGRATSIATKSSATDVVTQTDLDSERLIRSVLARRTPGAGVIGEEGGASGFAQRLQWVIDPLDGTVNFLYGVPIFSVSIAAALDGEFVAGAVVDAMRGETFSAHLGGGAHIDATTTHASDCIDLSRALLTTGFSYTPRLRAMQGTIVERLLPAARDIR